MQDETLPNSPLHATTPHSLGQRRPYRRQHLHRDTDDAPERRKHRAHGSGSSHHSNAPPPCYDHGTTAPRLLTLLLSDPQPVVRAGLVAALMPHPRMAVAATVASAPDLWTALAEVHAEVVIANPLLLGPTPHHAVQRLQRDDPTRKLVLFTPQPDLAVALLHHGVLGVVGMDEPLDYLVTAVLAASVGQRFVSPGVQTWADQYRLHAGVARLGPREVEVLALLAHGYRTLEQFS